MESSDPPPLSRTPDEACHATQEALLRGDVLKVWDDCPSCAAYGTRCLVAAHFSSASLVPTPGEEVALTDVPVAGKRRWAELTPAFDKCKKTRWDEPLNDDASSSSGAKNAVDAKKEKDSPERNITAAGALGSIILGVERCCNALILGLITNINRVGYFAGIIKSSSVGEISAHSSHEPRGSIEEATNYAHHDVDESSNQRFDGIQFKNPDRQKRVITALTKSNIRDFADLAECVKGMNRKEVTEFLEAKLQLTEVGDASVLAAVLMDPASAPITFTISPISIESKPAFDLAITRGNLLRRRYEALSENISKLLCTRNGDNSPKTFYFVDASSGAGKSQMAQSLSMPVVYIPLSTLQPIYFCFDTIRWNIIHALNKDLSVLRSDISLQSNDDTDYHVRSNILIDKMQERFSTVGLLMTLFESVLGKSNEASMKTLSGYDGEKTLTYVPTSIAEAKNRISGLYDQFGNGRFPIFMIDEVPAKDEKKEYTLCILLRNLIRCMNCVCLLSGTEAAAMNTIDKLSRGSRDVSAVEYMRLIIRLPPTEWSIFEADERYKHKLTALAQSSNGLVNILKKTRPLFVEFLLNALIELSKDSLTQQVLSKAKAYILLRKRKFSSPGGLYAQLALMHSALISRNTFLLPVEDTDTDTFEPLYCIRHHFATLFYDPNVEIIPLLLPSEANGKLKVLKSCATNETFEPTVVFKIPIDDPLLYLICLRDGVYFEKRRVPSSWALKYIYSESSRKNAPLFSNLNQKKCSGQYLKCEMQCAVLSASHSHSSLKGCPFPDFISSVVAELSICKTYRQFILKYVPSKYDAVLVPMLSPSNTTWNKADWIFNDIQLSDLIWSSNNDKNDGSFSVMFNSKSFCATIEAKCYMDKVPAEQVTGTIRRMNKDEFPTIVTIMAVTNIGEIQQNNSAFNAAVNNGAGVDVYRITKHDEENTLQCEPVHQLIKHCDSTRAILLIIVLESIFPGRYENMKEIYQGPT